MAKIVLGIGASHSPMINSTLEEWVAMMPREPGMKMLDREGRPSSYEALVAEAAGRYDADLHPDILTQRYHAVQDSLDKLADIIQNAKLDALIVIGDDQRELFLDDNLPSMLIYHGPNIRNTRREPKKEWIDWFAQVHRRYYASHEDAHFSACPMSSNKASLLKTGLAQAEPSAQRMLPKPQRMAAPS